MNVTSTYERIISNLNFLKSKESLAVLDQTLEQANKNNLTFIDGFLYFTQAQVEKKKQNLIQYSVKVAGFPSVKTLSEFNFDFQELINKQQIYDFNLLRFIDKQENIVFYGNSGVGKTHLAISIGVTESQNRKFSYFIKCARLIEILKKAKLKGRLEERLKKFCGYKLLIIDELGYPPITKEESKLFFQLIDRRYEKHSTIITTNINFSQWDDVFGDPLIASAIVDRLLHHSHVAKITGNSYRLKDFFQKADE